MSDGSKLATAIALVILGLVIAIWGAIFIWFYRRDQAIIQGWVARGAIGVVDAAQLSNSTWWWVLPAIQIIIGIGMIIWGIFQYFVNPTDVYEVGKAALGCARTEFVKRTSVPETTVLESVSRRVVA